MKVYVITKGEYSDYHICAVATNQAKARMLAEFYSDKYDAAEVEEYDTKDVPDLTNGRSVFRICFMPDGSAESIYRISPEYCDINKAWTYTNEPGYVYINVQANRRTAKRMPSRSAQKSGRNSWPNGWEFKED